MHRMNDNTGCYSLDKYFRESREWPTLCKLTALLGERGFKGYVVFLSCKLYISVDIKIRFLFFFTKTVNRTIGYFDLRQNFIRIMPEYQGEYQEKFRGWFPEYEIMEVMYSVDEVARAMCGKLGIEYDR